VSVLGSGEKVSETANTRQYGNWQILQLEEEEPATAAAAATKELSALSLTAPSANDHSQKLLLGATHSLRNMLLKLSPQVKNSVVASKAFTEAQSLVDGYAFSYRTSAYRLHYFESITGYRLLLLTGNGNSTSAATVPTAYGPVSVESCLKVLFGELIVGYCMHYPLGKLTCHEDDAFRRPGFVARLDEYILSVEKLF
jgi:hypothetical protein